MRSVYDAIKSARSLSPATRTVNTSGSVVDTAGYNSAKLVVVIGGIDNADDDETYVVKVQEGDKPDGSDATDVPELSITIDRNFNLHTVKNLRIEGLGTSRKRYLRAALVVGGTTPAIQISAVFELGRAYSEPVQ